MITLCSTFLFRCAHSLTFLFSSTSDVYKLGVEASVVCIQYTTMESLIKLLMTLDSFSVIIVFRVAQVIAAMKVLFLSEYGGKMLYVVLLFVLTDQLVPKCSLH